MAMSADPILQTTAKDNANDLASLGEQYYIKGDFQIALHSFETAFALDPSMINGAGMYAAILAKKNRTEELESLSSRLMAINDSVPEPWIAKAYLCFISRMRTEAIDVARKAHAINPHHVEALLLKGNMLLYSAEFDEAMSDFAEVFKLAPHRYEAYKGMVECLLEKDRIEEAIEVANNACNVLGKTSRTLTLHASILIDDPISGNKVIFLLEEALKQDPSYLKAVDMLARVYEQEILHEKGIELLKKYTASSGATCQMHQRLGAFLVKTGRHEEALHHFEMALNLSPFNRAVQDPDDALQRLLGSLQPDLEIDMISDDD